MDWKTFEGIVPAVVTPMNADGSVDLASLEALCVSMVQRGAAGVVALGGTGEYSALSAAERRAVIATAVKAVAGRVPVIAGMLSTGFEDSVETGLVLREAGADAVMPVTPYYVKPTQEGIFRYFCMLGERVRLPMFLYNIPGRTGVNTEPETIARLARESEWVVGMKQCNMEIPQFTRLMGLVGPDFCVLSGEDYMMFSHVSLGARGGILASANLVPELWVDLFRKLKAGDYQATAALQVKLMPLLDAIFAEINPGPLKAAMALMGRPVGGVRLPLVDPAPTTVERLRTVLAQFR